MADGAADGSAVVTPFAGFAVATEEDAHQPPVPPPPYDLPGFSGQTRPSLPKNLAHHWHTAAGNDRFNSMTWGEGGVRGNQSALHQRHDNNDDHLPEKARVRGWLITGTLDCPIPVNRSFRLIHSQSVQCSERLIRSPVSRCRSTRIVGFVNQRCAPQSPTKAKATISEWESPQLPLLLLFVHPPSSVLRHSVFSRACSSAVSQAGDWVTSWVAATAVMSSSWELRHP